MPETGDLRVSEAVALAHALVAHLAELKGIRILFVKGPTAVALGARPPRPSRGRLTLNPDSEPATVVDPRRAARARWK